MTSLATMAHEAAIKGFAFMDALDPKWADEDATKPINVDTLDMSDGELCMCAQHTGTDYEDGSNSMGVVTVATAVEYGFQAPLNLNQDDVEIYYRYLTTFWHAEIEDRREGAEEGTHNVARELAFAA